jgi:succinate dehydrogenase / fumarate reductase iron-sulfur subunit
VPKQAADRSMEAAACIGCGACVAACPNASAALFTGAKITALGLLPQGQAERMTRVRSMTAQARAEGFGHCSTVGECAAVCPAGIQLEVIARMNRDWLKATLTARDLDERLAVVPRTSPLHFYQHEPPKVEDVPAAAAAGSDRTAR